MPIFVLTKKNIDYLRISYTKKCIGRPHSYHTPKSNIGQCIFSANIVRIRKLFLTLTNIFRCSILKLRSEWKYLNLGRCCLLKSYPSLKLFYLEKISILKNNNNQPSKKCLTSLAKYVLSDAFHSFFI